MVTQSFFRVNGIIQEGASGSGVLISGASNVEFINCSVRNNPGHGFYIRGQTVTITGILIRNCKVSGNTLIGVRGGSDNWTVQIDGMIVEDSEISGNGNDGLACSNCRNLTIRRNVVKGNTGEDGIDIKQLSSHVLIEQNIVSGNKQAGIMINAAHGDEFPIYGGTNVIIRQNVVSNNGAHGIRLNSKEHGGYFIIARNVIVQNPATGFDGIYLFRGDNIGIYNNTVIGGNRAFVGQCLRASVIRNNIFVDSPNPAFHFQGSSANCTGYENGLITEDHNNFQSTGTYIITWINGKQYTSGTLGNYRTDSQQGTGTLSTKPLFSSTSTYDLGSNSPLIDRGVSVAGVTEAFAGAAPDLGYKEYTGGSILITPAAPTGLNTRVF